MNKKYLICTDDRIEMLFVADSREAAEAKVKWLETERELLHTMKDEASDVFEKNELVIRLEKENETLWTAAEMDIDEFDKVYTKNKKALGEVAKEIAAAILIKYGRNEAWDNLMDKIEGRDLIIIEVDSI